MEQYSWAKNKHKCRMNNGSLKWIETLKHRRCSRSFEFQDCTIILYASLCSSAMQVEHRDRTELQRQNNEKREEEYKNVHNFLIMWYVRAVHVSKNFSACPCLLYCWGAGISDRCLCCYFAFFVTYLHGLGIFKLST